MHIDDLPVEILVKIFRYLPTFNSVSLVSRRFYNVACDLGEHTIWLDLISVSIFLVSFALQNLTADNKI